MKFGFEKLNIVNDQGAMSLVKVDSCFIKKIVLQSRFSSLLLEMYFVKRP